MTEQDWLACTDPQKMLEFLRGKVSDRKLRLFACACCRRIWHHFEDKRSRRAVEVAERYADGHASDEELADAEDAAGDANCDGMGAASAAVPPASEDAYDAASALADPDYTLYDNFLDAVYHQWDASCGDYYTGKEKTGSTAPRKPSVEREISRVAKARIEAERGAQAMLLRDIFGNPFRPVVLDPSWRKPNVTKLAKSVYDKRAFDRLPVLADALVKAGCENADILHHCRQGREHVRGCWVVDVLLGKE
jgi:hypothetical protein